MGLGVWLLVGMGLWAGDHDLKARYGFSCAQCHGVDGSAKAADGSRLPGRVFADRRWMAKQKDEALVAVILEGKGAMPAFKHTLTPEDARKLVAGVIRPMGKRAR